MSYLPWVLAVALLFLRFVLKLFIDRRVTLLLFMDSMFELPVDIAFLATSFVVAFTIASPDNVDAGFAFFVAYVMCAVLVILCWRRSATLFEEEHQGWSAVLTVVNFAVSVSGLLMSITLISAAK